MPYNVSVAEVVFKVTANVQGLVFPKKMFLDQKKGHY